MISIMWTWANNPLALIAAFWLQLRCCKKGETMLQKFLPVILYLAGMAGCLAEGFIFTADESGPQVALMVCMFLAVHILVAELAWPIHWLVTAIKKRKTAKKAAQLDELHKNEENNL